MFLYKLGNSFSRLSAEKLITHNNISIVKQNKMDHHRHIIQVAEEIEHPHYGFYCDLEQEHPYIYDVVWSRNCYRVIRKSREPCNVKIHEYSSLPTEKSLTPFEKNMYVLIVFIISSIYLFWVV